MAQKVNIVLVDDIDGTDATETVSFGLDGTTYEIDLNDANAAALRDALAAYVGHARKVGAAPRRAAGVPPPPRPPRPPVAERQGDPRLGPLQRPRRPRAGPRLRRGARGLRRRALIRPRRRVGVTCPCTALSRRLDASGVTSRRPGDVYWRATPARGPACSLSADALVPCVRERVGCVTGLVLSYRSRRSGERDGPEAPGEMRMFERFTDRARRVVVLAQEEARMLSHNYIGTEHILLGLIHEGEGVAAKALESLDISLEAVRAQVEEIIGQGQQAPSGHIPFTPRAKKVLELSLREALQLGHSYIGTEHILLGLIREGEGVAAQVLQKLGADLNRVRQQVIQLLSGFQGKESAAAGAATGGAATRRPPRWCSTSSAATSPRTPARASSTRSSAASRRSSGSCRSCRAARRTTRCSSASPASARRPSSRAWPRTSSRATCPRRSRTSRSTPSTSAPWSPARATAVTSRSA